MREGTTPDESTPVLTFLIPENARETLRGYLTNSRALTNTGRFVPAGEPGGQPLDAIAALERQQGEARERIEGLTVAVKVAEREKCCYAKPPTFSASRRRPNASSVRRCRRSMLGPINRPREARTVFITAGTQVYALLHLDDTPFSVREAGADWEKLSVEFTRPPADRSTGARVMTR